MSALGKTGGILVAILGLGLLLTLLPSASAGFVAVGEGGDIRTSSTGTAWTARSSGVSVALHGVAYGNGLAVAVGEGGTILTSLDGFTWQKECPAGSGTGCPATTVTLRAVAYANSTWVAVGDDLTLLTSPDGSDWTPRSAPAGTNGDFLAVAFGGGQWAAGGRTPPSAVCGFSCWDYALLVYSPSGATWTNTAISGSNAFSSTHGLAYGFGHWLSVGPGSSNGASRERIPAPLAANSTGGASSSSGTGTCHAATYNGTQFVAACVNRIYRSPNGQTPWASTSTLTGHAIAFDGRGWAFVGPGGNAATSTTGATWTSHASNTTVDLNGLAVLPNKAPVQNFNGATFTGGLAGNVAQATPKDTDLVFSTANSNRITITDPDGLASAKYRVTLATTSGDLFLGGTSGLSFSCAVDSPLAGLPACLGDGTSDAAMTFDGSMADINTALSGLTFAPAAGTCDPTGATITLTTHDEGNHGPGGDLVDQDTVTVTVTCPAPTCTASPAAVLMGQTVTFTANPGRPPYTWSSPESSVPTTGAGPTHARSYAAFGTKTVTVTDSSTPTQSGTCTVQVVDTLSCSPANQSVLKGQATTVAVAGGVAPHAWSTAGSSNNGPTAGATWSGSFAQAGTYTVLVTDTAPSQQASCTVTVVPDLACLASPAPIVEGGSSTLTASGPPGPYTWTTGGAPATGTGATLAATYANAGTHTATVTSSNPSQSASCNLQARPQLGCMVSPAYVGRPATLTATGGTGNYSWATAGVPATGMGPVLAVKYATVGHKLVGVQDQGPPVQSATCLVDVRSALDYPEPLQDLEGRGHMAPVAHIRLLPRSPCGDWQVQLLGTGSLDLDGAVVAWSWSLPGGTQTEGPIATQTLPGPGNYVAFLEVKDDEGLTGWAFQTFALRACNTPGIPQAFEKEMSKVPTLPEKDPPTCTTTPLPAGCKQPVEPPLEPDAEEEPSTDQDPDVDPPGAVAKSSGKSSDQTEGEADGMPMLWAMGGTAALAVLALLAGIGAMAMRRRQR